MNDQIVTFAYGKVNKKGVLIRLVQIPKLTVAVIRSGKGKPYLVDYADIKI